MKFPPVLLFLTVLVGQVTKNTVGVYGQPPLHNWDPTGSPPPNDECQGAISVSLNTPASGSTITAQFDNGYVFCDYPIDSPGVWYKIVGNGNWFHVYTCGSDYSTALHVYQGVSCDALSCTVGNEDGSYLCDDSTELAFHSVAGETYHILVNGVRSVGNYRLLVTDALPPINENCYSAFPVNLNTPVSSSVLTAFDDSVSFDFCGSPLGEPGLWYKIVGNGNQFTAQTCGNLYDTQLHVYHGACGRLTCIGRNNDACGLQSLVVFDTVPGETYHILVHGFFDVGIYQLIVEGAERIEGGGDPHFTTWKQEHYEYHGQCDLVMLKDDNFADGLGIDIHIRTKLVRYWSYIKSVAIKIGNDILEIEGSANADDDQAHYWMSYEYQGELESIAGFPVTQKLPSTYKRSYTIDLSSKYPGQDITVQLYKEFVRVKINGEEMAFGNSVGLMGDYKTGKTLARDGVTVLDDFTELGDEWQVLPSDARLFREASHPQFPELCIKPEDPRGERQRRLGESEITVEQAESACASLKDVLAIKDCVYDILATQDLDMVAAF